MADSWGITASPYPCERTPDADHLPAGLLRSLVCSNFDALEVAVVVVAVVVAKDYYDGLMSRWVYSFDHVPPVTAAVDSAAAAGSADVVGLAAAVAGPAAAVADPSVAIVEAACCNDVSVLQGPLPHAASVVASWDYWAAVGAEPVAFEVVSFDLLQNI